jgi:hypothetical protein
MTRKEAFVDEFEIVLRYLPVGPEENHKNLIMVRASAEMRYRYLQSIDQKRYCFSHNPRFATLLGKYINNHVFFYSWTERLAVSL